MTSVQWLGEVVESDVRAACAKGINSSALVYESYARRKVQSASINRVGRDGNPLRQGRSLPGQFPATDQGGFKNSLTTASAPADGSKLLASFGVFDGKERIAYSQVGVGGRGYPYYLQVGTRKMRPRPWLTLTIRNATGPARDVFMRTAKSELARRAQASAQNVGGGEELDEQG